MSGRVARDLASTYENWLENSSIPEAPLPQVSVRTLARIGNSEHSLKVKLEDYLNQKIKYKEWDLSCFLRNPSLTQNSID